MNLYPKCVLLLILLLIPVSIQAQAEPPPLAVSTFDTDTEGWTTVGDTVEGSLPRFVPTGGNPGGYLSATDAERQARWYWSAPAKFRGNFSPLYGRTLTFDLRQSDTQNQNSYSDVVLIGGGVVLWFDTPTNPASTWTSYEVVLEEAGWENRITDLAATREEMETVLGSLDSLLIRGEYRSGTDGTDVGDIDNVILGGSATNLSSRLYLPLISR